MNIYGKLSAIQVELKAPKGQYNSFGRYSYRSCEDIMEAVKPLLDKHKVALVVKDDIVLVGDRYYVKATATLYDSEAMDISNYKQMLADTNEQVATIDNMSISSSAYAREGENKKGMDDSQLTGATSSYARKYALNGLFAIDDVKDSDATNTHGKEKVVVKQGTDGFGTISKGISDAQFKRLMAIANKAGIKKEVLEGQVKKEFHCEIKEMNKDQYKNICDRLEAKAK